VTERRLELVALQTVNGQYEQLLREFATLVNSAQVTVASIDDKISAETVQQLTDLLCDSQVGPDIIYILPSVYWFTL